MWNKTFLNILSAYLNHSDISIEDDISWDSVLHMAQIHSVQPIVYLVLENANVKPYIYDELKKGFLLSVSLSMIQAAQMESVIQTLTAENIPHMLMKGYILRNYYPDKEARTFGDIDFLIDEADRERCHNALLKLGFEYDAEKYLREVRTYKKGNVVLEVHTEIIYEELFFNFDYRAYFNEKVKNKLLIGGCTYELRKEDHFIYILVHLAKHFYNAGVGIRMILDVAVFLNRLGKEMDMDYIMGELRYIKLDSFANIIFFICKKYFNVDIDCTPIAQADLDKIMDYILRHGVFGFEDKDVQGVFFQKNGDSGVKLLIQKAFPDLSTMRSFFPWFANGKKYMLPYAWVRRWLYFLTNKTKRGALGSKFSAIVDDNEDIARHIDMLRTVGLK